MLGSNHCTIAFPLLDFRFNSDEILGHWFFPYFITAALRISSRCPDAALDLTAATRRARACSSFGMRRSGCVEMRSCARSSRRSTERRLDAASRASACDRAVEGAVEGRGLDGRARGAANEGSGGEGWSYRCIMIKRRAVIMCAVMCAFGRACR